LVFDRPTAELKVYDSLGQLYHTYAAQGDAWGNHDGSSPQPYGFDCWCPPGHYRLGVPQFFSTPIASEGFGQIPVMDLDAEALAQLVSSGHAVVGGTVANIGGIPLDLNQLSKWNRSGIMIHCGGSDAPDPLADYQMLCRTNGCTRVGNLDWRNLAHWLEPQFSGNIVILSIVGDPQILSC
jgi:hypothetical protein